jgi:hypothetical protein
MTHREEDAPMIKHSIAATALAGAVALPAFAAEGPEGSDTRFRSLDSNRDGHVQLYEARDRHRVFYYYQKADKNDDGAIDKVEFSAFELEVPDYEAK